MNEGTEIWKTEEGKYYAQIEEYLGRKRGYPLILSVKEWYIAKCWFEEGIPISIVKEAIDKIAQIKDIRTERISLAYCNNLVIKLWKDYKKVFSMKVMESDEKEGQLKIDGDYLINHLDEIIINVQQIIKELEEEKKDVLIVFQNVIKGIEKLKERYSNKELTAIRLDKIEQSLFKIEKKMINDLIARLPDNVLEKLLNEAKQIISKKTIETFVKRRLYEEFKIGRFSIYTKIMKEDKD